MAKQYWLMKSEPDVYSYDDLVAEGEGRWDGVRNHSAAINLRSMKLGDEAFFYHSNIGLEIVAIMTISQEYFIDPTDEKARFVAVKVMDVIAIDHNIVNVCKIKSVRTQIGEVVSRNLQTCHISKGGRSEKLCDVVV